MSNEARYCWDTCVFIAWLKEETDKPLADIQAVLSEIDDGDGILIVPVTIYTEMQRSKFQKNKWRQFEKSLTRSNVIVADITATIAQRASQVRDKAESEGRKIKTGDATIIATAIIYNANALHTFDPPLLNLHKSDTVGGLSITHPLPRSGQHGLLHE